MSRVIEIDGLSILVTYKKMKNLRLKVKPPRGEVFLSVPRNISLKEIHDFVLSESSWIKARRAEYAKLPPPKVLIYEDGEKHLHWGGVKTIRCIYSDGRQRVDIDDDSIILTLKPGASPEQREKLLREHYRNELKNAVPDLVAHYEQLMGCQVASWGIKKMKRCWGTCNIRDLRICLNLELVHYPLICLEYVVVHEMVHFFERLHNQRFWQLVECFMPSWREAEVLLRSQNNKLIQNI